ncbi:hypothetical protein SDC9_179091 [bioreactor metagenome]|uniref:Uncharacterized protein n=1 Tax=bioreactor metagenome TaxID=1076179 RepID=A0A645GY05_9ZZZZ
MAFHTRNLPVANGGVFALALLDQPCKAGLRRRHRRAAGHIINIKHAKAAQDRGAEFGTFRNRCQGIAALITKSCCVWRFANPKAI